MRYKGKQDRRNRVGSSAAQYIVEVGIEKLETPRTKDAPRISNPGSEKKFRFRLSVSASGKFRFRADKAGGLLPHVGAQSTQKSKAAAAPRPA
jgi:hypothetical protein